MSRQRLDWYLVRYTAHWKDSTGKAKAKTIWKVRYRVGNKTKTESTHETIEKKAYAKAMKWAEDGRFNGSPLFVDYSAKFFTENCPYCNGLASHGRPLEQSWINALRVMLNKVLMVDFAQLTIKELSVARLRAYFMGKSGLGKSASTIENYKKALRPVLDQAVEDKILLVNPLNSVPAFVKNFRVNPPKYTPTNKEVLKLFFSENHWGKGAIDPYFRMAFVGANTGARIGELQALQRKHIKFNPEAQVMKLLIEQSMKEGTKTIGPTKTKRKRWVPLVGLAVSLVLLDLGNDPEEFVFKSKGKPLRQRMTNIRLKQAYDELIEVSHPAMFSFHSLRHWFDTRMLILTTQNRLLVRMLMGHYDSKDQTQEYKDEGTEEEFDGSIPYLRELFNFGEEPESKYKVLPTLYLQ